ncbi:hypothetical protein Riv7116_3156 [Rivularia sp. PCC 7116]|uniref:DUF2294 domain-containing protein n=1 Tax=Rivularia sp. PCC 7116 TaxID=373994 RepID=UPI00029F2D24|nr:DUF2294 domain-containing protein [Rivularia sp. PCC 7116]AFY55629.1 hypothetical protein Riv7116_3156 [Rivularia sp. PCC 7116]
MLKTDAITVGQLERELSQRIQSFYRNLLGNIPIKVSCHLFANKLVVLAENSITTAEKVLIEVGKEELAQKFRVNLEQSIRLKLKSLIEEISQVEIADLLSETSLDTELTGIIVVFNKIPKLRASRNSVSK